MISRKDMIEAVRHLVIQTYTLLEASEMYSKQSFAHGFQVILDETESTHVQLTELLSLIDPKGFKKFMAATKERREPENNEY